jgi:hypothetical protein
MCLDSLYFGGWKVWLVWLSNYPQHVVKDLNFHQFGFCVKRKSGSHKWILIGYLQLLASIFPEKSHCPALELWNSGSMASLKQPNLDSSTAMQIKANGTDSSPPFSTVEVSFRRFSCDWHMGHVETSGFGKTKGSGIVLGIVFFPFRDIFLEPCFTARFPC